MNEYSEKTDPTLVDLTLLGDDGAFEELVERHQKRVLGTAYKVTSNRWAAEDAAQDAFVSAWMHLSALEDKEAFGAWVCAISKNQAYRLMRRYSAAIDVSLDLAEFTEPADKAAEDASELREAVDSLSEVLRETVKLHYFGGYQVSEIAEMLSVPVGTVKWRLTEARKQLRKGYGIMEKTYDENETLTERVMRQVEELKLWSLKSDKSGFEQDYKNVLAAVESLDESDRKQYALADVLMRGYWWLGGNKDEIFARMKEAAVKSRNEDVMQTIVAKEMFDIKDRKKRIEFTRGRLIPRLETEGWTKPLGYAWFWLGHDYRETDEREKMFEAFEKVTALLDESCVYYANALAAMYIEKKTGGKPTDFMKQNFGATGEQLKLIDGKLWFWQQPGYGGSISDPAIFCYTSCADSLLFDPDMKVGESFAASDKKSTLTYVTDNETVITAAGRFENCSMYRFIGNIYGITLSETWFCPNVGIVAQNWTRYGENHTCELYKYKVTGTGLLPLDVGNKWYYQLTDRSDAKMFDSEKLFTVVYNDKKTVNLSASNYYEVKDYLDTWNGNILRARETYFGDPNNEHIDKNIFSCLERAEKQAVTERQKVHTSIAKDVMRRIIDTDRETNPDCTGIGRWNFFEYINVQTHDRNIVLSDNRKYSFEWKYTTENWSDEASKILYNFLYEIINDDLGCVWSDEWIPGYRREVELTPENGYYGYTNGKLAFEVLDDEPTETPAGRFDSCRHIKYSIHADKGRVWYFMGDFELWYADGVGLVKLSRPLKTPNVWHLTEYIGTGEGYFPTEDGLFRRYEPETLGEGLHASVEYTTVADEEGVTIFRNALGTQDRAAFEEFEAKNKQNN